MSAATLNPPTVRTHAIKAARTTTPRVIRSEWIKLRTLRSTWLTIGGMLFALFPLALAGAARSWRRGPATRCRAGSPRPAGSSSERRHEPLDRRVDHVESLAAGEADEVTAVLGVHVER